MHILLYHKKGNSLSDVGVGGGVCVCGGRGTIQSTKWLPHLVLFIEHGEYKLSFISC